MRKKNLIFGALVLGLGVIIGTLGVTLLMNPSSPSSFISKLRGQNNIQTVSGEVNDPTQNPPIQVHDDPSADDSSAADAGFNADPDTNSNQVNQQIIAAYKQDVGIFFEAWKSADINTFRLKLAKAYTGELLEKHARRAEEFLVRGVGLDVTQIIFDQVTLESADANTATLRADYRYKARDYSLADRASFGEEYEQTVQVRVNLIKLKSRWMITGESSIQ